MLYTPAHTHTYTHKSITYNKVNTNVDFPRTGTTETISLVTSSPICYNNVCFTLHISFMFHYMTRFSMYRVGNYIPSGHFGLDVEKVLKSVRIFRRRNIDVESTSNPSSLGCEGLSVLIHSGLHSHYSI